MNSIRACVLAACCAVVLAFGTASRHVWSAPTGGLSPHSVPVVKPDGLTADGDLSDWRRLGPAVVIDRDHLAGGWLDCTPDARARLRLAYDATHLWLALSVDDRSVRPLEKPSKQPGKFWEQDGAGVYLDVPGTNVASGRYQTRPTRPWTTHPIIQLTPSTHNYGRETLPPGSRYGCRVSAGGYTVEAAVPWRSLGWAPRAGDRIFFGAIVADIDTGKDGRRGPLQQIIWHMAADDMTSSRSWAPARLMDAGGFGGEILTGAPRVTTRTPVNWKLMADASTPGWTIRQVALKRAGAATRTLVSSPVVVVPGRTAVLTGEVNTHSTPPGTYTLVASAMKGGLAAQVVQTLVVADPAAKVVQHKASPVPQQLLIPDPIRSRARLLSEHPPITHETYRAFVDKQVAVGWPAFAYHLRAKTALGGGWWLEYGLRMAAYAKITREAVWVQRAQQMFEMADAQFRAKKYAGLGWINMPLIYYYKQYLSAVKAWKPGYDAIVQDWYLHTYPGFPKSPKQVWRGMNNWGLSSGIRGVMGQYWLGDRLPDKAKWAKHIAETWGEFLNKIKDIDENTTNYAPWDLWLILFYLDAKGQTDRLKTDAKLRYLYERYIYEIAPCGARPQYGSTNGWHDAPALWMYVFERVGQIVGDGRYKHQARLIWDYSTNHVENWHQYHLVYDQTVTMLTRLLAEVPDDGLKAAPIQAKSIATTRGRMRLLPPDERARRNMWVETYADPVPNKIIFRGSNDPKSLWAMVEMNGEAGHCSARPTSVNCLMDRETVLLASQGYHEQDARFHNMILIEDLEGTQGLQPAQTITLPVMAEFRCGVYALAQVERYLRWPVTLRRHFVFVKDRLMWVRDEVQCHSSFFARIGPCWLSRQLGSTTGANWANTWFDMMPYTGLGRGGGMHRWRNDYYDLLTYFVPRPDSRIMVSDLTPQNPYMNAPLQVRYAWRGLAREGATLWFDSLLVPHPPQIPETGPKPIADGIRVLASADDQTALLADLPWRHEKVLVLQSRRPFDGAGVRTDAKEAVVVWRGKAIVDWFVRGATYLKVGDQTCFQSAKPVDKQK